jgi:hypothetical protein
LRVASLEEEISALQGVITAEEARQQAVNRDVERVLGPLRRDIDELAALVARLEGRLDRLEFANRPLSDSELDDEEHDERAESAAFWAEWRRQREERRDDLPWRPTRKRDNGLRKLYRLLARQIHPDLAVDARDRARRETAMRLANVAFEAGDREQLNRLLSTWTRAEEPALAPSVQNLRLLLARRQEQLEELGRSYEEIVRSELGKLARSSASARQRAIERELERLRRDLASLRLRRRRLKRTLDSRRQQLSSVSD